MGKGVRVESGVRGGAPRKILFLRTFTRSGALIPSKIARARRGESPARVSASLADSVLNSLAIWFLRPGSRW